MVLGPLDDFRFQRAIDFLMDAGAHIDEKTTWLDLGWSYGQKLVTA